MAKKDNKITWENVSNEIKNEMFRALEEIARKHKVNFIGELSLPRHKFVNSLLEDRIALGTIVKMNLRDYRTVCKKVNDSVDQKENVWVFLGSEQRECAFGQQLAVRLLHIPTGDDRVFFYSDKNKLKLINRLTPIKK
jgi:hypothetical protein